MNKIHDTLTIGFECTNGEDESFLLIARDLSDRITVINKYEGEAAEELYSILVGNDNWKGE